MVANIRQPGAVRRLEQFLRERLGDLSAVGFAPEEAAVERRKVLDEYRRRQRDQAPAGRRRRAGRAGLGPVPPPGPNWIPIGPLAVRNGQAATKPAVSGRVSGLAVSADGRRVYAASANGGVWRSEDFGRSWVPTMDELELNPTTRQVDSLACGAIAMVEGADREHDRLYVGTGEGHVLAGLPASGYFGAGMLLSTNGGATWTREASDVSLEGAGVFNVAVDPADPDHAVAATTIGLFRRTAASAATPTPWLHQTGGVVVAGQFTSVVSYRRGTVTHFVAGTNAGVVIDFSTATNAWSALGTGFNTVNAGRLSLAVSASTPPVVYALVATVSAGGSFQGLYRLDVGDPAPRPWRAVAGGPPNLFGGGPNFQGGYDQCIVVDPGNPDRVYLGGSTLLIAGEWSGSLFRTEVATVGAGAGRTFTATNTLIGGSVHADLHELTFKPGGPDLWVGCDGGVFTSTNPAATGDRLFQSRNAGLGTLTLNGMGHHPTEESFVFCGAQDCGGLRYTGSEVWDHQLPGDGGDTVFDWQTGTRFLNIYTNATVRNANTDGPRYANVGAGPALGGEASLFYPPMVGAPPSGNAADANFVAFGAQRPWVTTTFGGAWNPLPAHPVGGGLVRSIAVVSPTRLYAGWTNGNVARYDLIGAGWVVADHSRAGEGRDITGIAVDTADASGQSVYVTIAGTGASHVWHLDSSTGTPGTWADRSGTGTPNPLLNIQHSAIAVDTATPATLYVAADLGVWQSTDSGTNWTVFSGNLPDAAVLDLDLHPVTRLLRATTHGRGAFELPLGVPQPGVELVLRTNVLDQRRRAARAGVALPGALATTSAFDASPDIAVDPPSNDNVYAVDPSRTPNLVELAEALTRHEVLASVPEAPVVTRVHVTVRNRGVTAADDVRVALLVGPIDGGTPDQLPAGFAAAATAGTNVEGSGWKTVGIHTVGGLKAGGPKVVTFELSSDVLPVAPDAAGKDFALLALVHHAADPLPAGAPRVVHTLVAGERRSALLKVRATAAQVAPSGGGSGAAAASGAPGGDGLVVPVTNALLAYRRLDDIVDQLERKVKSSRVSPGFAGFTADVQVHPVERRVLAMATQARAAMRAGPPAAVPRDVPGHGIGSYALLGALGFELPAYAGMLAPAGGWVADVLRRGTPDPNRSLVKVPSSELPLAVGRIGIGATAGGDQERVRAFSAGMLAAVGAGVVVGPQQADLHAVDTNADWSRHSPSTGAAALARHLRHRFLGGDGQPSGLATWLPPPADVPTKLWDSYIKGIEEVYGLPADRVKGFKAFEDGFDAGDWLTTVRLGNAYGLVLEDVRSTAWPWPAYWGLISPILLAPSISMLFAPLLPNAKKFFDPTATIDERAVFELLMLSMGIGSVAPFLYSMILWGAVDEHTEAFVNALLMGLARGALFGAALGTASDQDQSNLTRWLGIFAPMASLDVYSLVRALVAGGRRPGVRTVFALQTIPALTGLTTLGLSAVLKGLGVSDGTDWPFWLIWSLHTAGVLFGIGIPVAMALSNGGGWRSWFLRSDVKLPVISSVANTTALPPEPVARARLYDTSTLWPDPLLAAPDLADFAFPSGMRPLVRVWWEGDGDLQISHDNDTIVLRRAAGDARIVIPAGTTAAGLVTLLTSADPGVRAEVVGEGEVLTPTLPWPRSLADPGDAGPAAFAPVSRVRFEPVGTSKGNAVVLRHAPRADLSTLAGLSTTSIAAVPVLPTAGLGDLAGAGLGEAADLAALLATAAAPTFGPVTTAGDGLPPLGTPAVAEVVQVFRRWNLDERRLEEWRTLVTGGAAREPAPAGNPDPLARTPFVGYAGPQPVGADLLAAMGWLPLWRAWLAIATDLAAGAGAPFAQPSTPLVRFADGSVRRPTNAQLTEGVRHLLDLGAA